MSEKIFCDICGTEFSDVYRGVRTDEPIEAKVGSKVFDDICQKCYKSLYEYIESLKKQ